MRLKGEGTSGSRSARAPRPRCWSRRCRSCSCASCLPLAAAAQTHGAEPRPKPARRSRSSTTRSSSKRHSIRKPASFRTSSASCGSSDAWELAFTQEWPVASQKHQLSYTVPFLDHSGRSTGVGNMLINYRYQATMEDPGMPAFSPRLSLILPTDNRGDDSRGSAGQPAAQQAARRLLLPLNAGFTWLRRVEGPNDGVSLTTPSRLRQRHLSAAADVQPDARERAGVRGGSKRLDGGTERQTIVHALTRRARRLEHRRPPADSRRRDSDHVRRRDRRGGVPVLSYELPFKR